MSGIGFCIDCGHSRKATRPPCARNRALRVENNCVSRESAFCEKNGEFPKMGAKKYFHPRQEHIFPESEKKIRSGERCTPVLRYTHAGFCASRRRYAPFSDTMRCGDRGRLASLGAVYRDAGMVCSTYSFSTQ